MSDKEISNEEDELISTNTEDINNPRFKDPVPQRALTHRRLKGNQQDNTKIMKLKRRALAAKHEGQKLVA